MLWQSIEYVVSAYMFWQAIILTCGMGMVFGMALHNGDVRSATKAIIGTVPMILLMAAVSYFRVAPNIYSGIETTKTYAGLITSIFVGTAYLVGFFGGVLLLRYTYRNTHNNGVNQCQLHPIRNQGAELR